MRLHRFFVAEDIAKPIIAIRDAALCHQLMKVLRMKKGDHIILCDGRNHEVVAEIEDLKPAIVRCALLEEREVTAEPKHLVTLYCSVLKRENFEWVVEKATEVGVLAIVPIIAERTVKMGLKMERLFVIAKEAAEQSGRGVIPEVHEPIALEKALESLHPKQKNYFFHISPNAQRPTLNATPSGVWIGPEGGWTEKEVQSVQDKNFVITSLGSLTLRAETAAVVASYLAVHA